MNQAKHCKGIRGNNVFRFGYEHRLGPFRSKHPNGLSGAEKRRKRKGGNPKGGPGGGGIQGSMRRLKEALDKRDPSLRGHTVGKGVA